MPNKNFTKTAAVLIAVTLSLTACASGDVIEEDVPLVETSASPTTTAPEAPEPTVEAEKVSGLDYSLNEKFGIEATGPVLTDNYGTYTQVQLRDDSILSVYNPDVSDQGVKDTYTPEEVAQAQKIISSFLVSQSLDSPLVWDDSQEAKDTFIAETESFVDPEWFGDYNDLFGYDDGKGYIVVDSNDTSWRESTQNIKPFPYQENTPRYTVNDISVTSISLTDDGGLRFDYALDYNRAVLSADEKVRKENVTATRSYGLTKDANGVWKLAGWAQEANFNFSDAE